MKNIDCVLKLSISYVLKKILEKLVTNVYSWDEIKFNEEIKVFHFLNQHLQNTQVCEKHCVGCLDYILVDKIFGEFHKNIEENNKKYKKLLIAIDKKFNLNIEDPIELALNLIVKPKYVENKLNSVQLEEYKQYVSNVNSFLNNLKLSYYNQRIMELHDVILNNSNLEQMQRSNAKKIKISNMQKFFYIDQNFIGKYINDNSFKKQIEKLKEVSNYQFIFSPYLIEDGIKMNKLFLKDYFEHITKLTNNILMTRYDNELCFVEEKIDSIVDRVILWLEPTKAAEKLKVFWYEFNKCAYPYFKIDKKNILYQKINNDVQNFFKELNTTFIMQEDDFNITMEKVLYSKTIELGISLEEIKNGKILVKNDFEKIETIQKLCDLLDFINYQVDTKEQKIKSSYQDTEHLKHAWKCNYFITDDKKLIKRGQFIYELLNINTKFISSDEFKKKMIEILKK